MDVLLFLIVGLQNPQGFFCPQGKLFYSPQKDIVVCGKISGNGSINLEQLSSQQAVQGFCSQATLNYNNVSKETNEATNFCRIW